MKTKIIIGILIGIIYYITIKTKKIKLLYKLVLDLAIIELTYNFIKYYKTNNHNMILYIISISKILLCKKLLKSNKIHNNELNLLLINTSLNDIFQELIGKLFGKTKATKISPNKTLEGYLGGMIMSVIANKILFKKKIKYSSIIYISNVFGDLFFSNIKRKYGIKDFSRILLDHGGILDRHDSLILGTISHILIKNI
jgi:phosphatidate cytidylyltransferase